jgi:hypothetical protein
MSAEKHPEGEHHSRRSVLKKAAAAGAVAWAAPAITTVGGQAFAAGTPKCATCEACYIGPRPECGSGCICQRAIDGSCYCVQDLDFSDPNVFPCAPDCPAGWVCTDALGCLDPSLSFPVCVPVCP